MSMNRIKSLFISVYITALALGAVRAVWLALEKQAEAPWVLLALVPGLLFFAWLFLFKVARTGYASVVIWLGPVLAMGGLLGMGSASAEAWAWSGVIGLVCGVLYIRWYSRFGKRDSEILRVGNTLPDLVFEDAQGGAFKTADVDAGMLLMFYRGNWCPLCMAQIKEVAAQYRELEQRGIKVLFISPQPHDFTEELARKFDAPMTFLVDKDNRVAEQLGIKAEAGTPAGMEVLGYESDTVMPTVVMTDAKRRIIFADLTDNYRIRPEPETFLRVLDAEGVVAVP